MTIKRRLRRLEEQRGGGANWRPMPPWDGLAFCDRRLGLPPGTVRGLAEAQHTSPAQVVADLLGLPLADFRRRLEEQSQYFGGKRL